MRYPLVIGNWKLNGSKQMTNKLIKDLHKNLYKIKGCNIVIAPPVIYLDRAMKALYMSNIILGAQNVDVNLVGAFTGELSANMLKDIGVKYVIIGHSERRIYHKESNKLIAEKFAVLKNVGLIPVLCIGETESENIAGETKKVCANQINAILDKLGVEAFKNSVIAYEPIWAIGTGKSATPEKIQAVHKFIRNYLSNKDAEIAEQVIIQYGGSVNNKNAIDLLYQPDIDGVLVGNSSLKVDHFTEIVKITSIAKEKL